MRCLLCLSASLFLGSLGYAQHAVLRVSDPNFPNSFQSSSFGVKAAIVGDLDQDGRNDLLVSDGNLGRVYAFSGQTGAVLWSVAQGTSPPLGRTTLASVGRIDNDATPDVLMSSGSTLGGYQIRSGVDGLLLRQGGTLHPGTTGHADSLGDVDNDGFGDYFVGFGLNPLFNFGRLYIVSGATHTVIRFHDGTANSPFQPRGGRGTTFSEVGDIDLDGVVDYAMPYGEALPFSSIPGLDVFSGATGSLLFGDRSAIGFEASTTLRPVGDYDGDGIPDINYLVISGCCIYQAVTDNAIYSGATGLRLPGFSPPNAPYVIGRFNDLNGDGRDEFLAQSSTFSQVALSLIDPANLGVVLQFESPLAGGFFPPRSSGDLNGDGLDDVAVAIRDDSTSSIPADVPARVIVFSPALPPLSEEFCFGNGGTAPGCTPCACGNDANADERGGCNNPEGRSARLMVAGETQVLGGNMRFEIVNASPSSFALLISGQNPLPLSGPCAPGSGISGTILDGLRCVGGDFKRHGSRAIDVRGNVGISNSGWGTPDPPLGGLMLQAGVSTGQTRYFQAFYRVDLAAGCGTGVNTTNAVSVTAQP